MFKKHAFKFIGAFVFALAMFFAVNEAEAAVPVINFYPDSASISTGSSTNLNWDVTDAVNCVASGDWSGSKAFVGTESVGPFSTPATYSFTLTCTGDAAEVQSDTVTVTVADPPTLNFFADSTTIEYNTATNLNWSTTNATDCTASGDWTGTKATSGSESTGNLISAKSYTLTCNGPGGTAIGTVPISITSPVTVPTLNFSASSYFINYDENVDLSWDSTNATACVASGDWSGSKALSDSQNTGNLTSTSVFSLTCSGTGGSITSIVTVVVSPAPVNPPELTFTATDYDIAYASSTTLNWSSLYTDDCDASGSWSGSRSLNGSYDTGTLYSTASYTLDCDGPGGTVTQTVTVNVGPNPFPAPTLSFSAASTSVPYNGSTDLNWSTTNADSCTASDDWSGSKGASGTENTGTLTSDQEYDLDCTGPGGTVSDSEVVAVGDPTTPPVVTFWADTYNVVHNTGTVVRWNSTDANWCDLTQGGDTDSVGLSGSDSTGNLTSNTVYSLSCGNAAGTTTQAFTITVTTVGAAPSISLWADDNPVNYGGSTTVRWDTTNADSCSMVGYGSVSVDGSMGTGTLYDPVTYTLACVGPGGSSSDSITIIVDPATIPEDPPLVDLWADSYALLEGENTDLHWTSTNADWCTASDGWSGSRPGSGDENTGVLYTTTTYTITCGNIQGEASDSVTITIGNFPAVALDFWADSYDVAANGYTTLRWDSTNATTCYTYGGEWGSWSSRALDGTETIGPLSDYTNVYVLRCANYLDTETVSVTINAGDPPPSVAFHASSTRLVYNTPATLFWNATNATYCETWSSNSNEPTWDHSSIDPSGTHTTTNLRQNTRFYIRCYGPGGDSQESVYVTIVDQGNPAPSINFWADNYGVSMGGSTNIHWTTTNATGCRALSDTDIGWAEDPKDTSGNQSVGPITESTNTLYLACWNGSYGSATTSLTITTGEGSVEKPSMSFWADAYSVASGSSTILRWNSTNADNCTASGGDWSGDKATGVGFEDTGALVANGHYELTCTNSGGSMSSFVDIIVGGPAAAPSLTFWADDYDIEAGEVVNLSWTSANATTCYASGGVTTDWTGAQLLNGSRGVYPAYSTTFELTCDGPGGSITANIPIKVSRVLVCPDDVRVNRLQTRQLTAYYAEDASPLLSCSNLSGTVNIINGYDGFPTDWETDDSGIVSLQPTPGLIYAESYSESPINVCAVYKELRGCAGIRVVTTCWECQAGPACVPVGIGADTCPAPYFSDSPSCLNVCALQWGDWREVAP